MDNINTAQILQELTQKKQPSEFLDTIIYGGALKLRYRKFADPVRFRNCVFVVEVDFSGCIFEQGLEFIGCVFHKRVSLVAAEITRDCQFRACRFEEEADFDRLKVKGKLELRAPSNRKEIKGCLNYYYICNNPYVTFCKEARFSQIHVTGEANFGSAQFRGWVDFYNAKIEGPAFFRIDRCKAKEEPFDNAIFKKNPVRFHRGVRFRFAQFGGELNFHGADFSIAKPSNSADDPWKDKDTAKDSLTKKRLVSKPIVDFTHVRCNGVVFFCDPEQPGEGDSKCLFESAYGDDFKDITQLRAILNFEGARFDRSVYFHADFPSPDNGPSHIVSFKDCRIDGELAFFPRPLESKHTLCERLAEKWKQSGASSNQPEDKDRSIPKYLELTGCSYKRINANIEKIAGRIETMENATSKGKQDYDRRSWTQLESSLRAEGFPQEADRIYVRRRKARHKSLECGVLKAIDGCFGMLMDYGVSNLRMLVLSIFLIIGFAGIYGNWGSFKLEFGKTYSLCGYAFSDGFTCAYKPLCAINQAQGQIPGQGAVQTNCTPSLASSLPNYGQRLLLISTEYFLPFTLPDASDFKPTDGKTKILALLEKGLGWILVPLLIANLAGFLHTKAKPQSESGGEK